ncbi:hypothetical protein MOQ_000107 [Trypanosoma cruzi marinkellei]|uniref:Uncharacterized protein n=1 Tax=Trypanosoma cruzi marinkellei TaxID=85056 RepID=K2MWR8_TRYCR|nr:hypothetical protein MOQ_000107 [Trypanosoma cruzi marinkellei]
MYTNLEEHASTVWLPVHFDTHGVASYEAEGHGTGGLDCVGEMQMDWKRGNSINLCGTDAELSPVNVPLLNHHHKSSRMTDWEKLFQIESELQYLGEEVGFFLQKLGRSSVVENSLDSVDDTVELGEALQMVEGRLNSIFAGCHDSGISQRFLSNDALQKATDCSRALMAYRGVAAAAESMRKLLTGVFNCRVFLPFGADAMKRAGEVSLLLDDMEKVLDSLEARVETLRELSETRLDVLKGGLDDLSK